MENTIYTDVKRRHDFILLFDVTRGNPNCDPDADNMPRMDLETRHGLVTDGCIKRKVRDWVLAYKEDESPYRIYVQSSAALNRRHREAHETLKLPKGEKRDSRDKGRAWMCQHFYDVRMFGAVMDTGDYQCGQVRGPLQLVLADSQDKINPFDISLTRCTPTEEDKWEKGQLGTMGKKYVVPYALYCMYGFFNSHYAVGTERQPEKGTGVATEDLILLWQALENMWDLDRSAARGLMGCKGLYVFSHESRLGDAPAHRLFERIKATRRDDVSVPRAFSDYTVTVDGTEMDIEKPRSMTDKVTLTRLC